MNIEICRLCKNANITEFNSKNIFIDENSEIIHKLELTTNIMLEKDDQLPKFICEDCEFDLNIAFNFRMKCEKIDAELRELCEHELCKLEIAIVEYENISYIPLEKDITKEKNFVDDRDYVKFQNTITDIQALEDTSFKSENINYSLSNEDDENDFKIEILSTNNEDDNLNEEVANNSLKNFGSKSKHTKIFVCETCQFTSNLYTEYCMHIKTHGSKRFQCVDCSAWYKTKSKLKFHIDQSHTDLTCPCEYCGKILSNLHNLERHISSQHYKLRPYICNICEQQFTRSDNLKQHFTTVHNYIRNNICDVDNCNKTFNNLRSLKLHKSRVHSLINSNGKNTENLKNHKKFQCPQCNKSLKSNASLKQHLGSHNNEKPYLCTECGKCFRAKTSLNIHSLIHKNLKPYKCKICCVAFRQYPHLKAHQITHTGEKNTKCDICNKLFAKTYIREHMRIHLGISKKRLRRKKITTDEIDIVTTTS